MLRPASLLGRLLLGVAAAQMVTVTVSGQDLAHSNLFPGYSAAPSGTAFPGVAATAAADALAGATPSPIATLPLTAPPSVLSLEHVAPPAMTDSDVQLVARLHAELLEQAAHANFDLSDPAWHYEQIVCPAFPDYVLLAFDRGLGKEGSSRFVAILPRQGEPVRLLAAYAHGLLPFQMSWERAGSLETFNRMLRRERGKASLSEAPNWLLIGMSFAELTGYPVQVPTTLPYPAPTLDLLRLDANRPQLFVDPDESASIRFSDVSQPRVTGHWILEFDRTGQIRSVSRELTRQGGEVALAP